MIREKKLLKCKTKAPSRVCVILKYTHRAPCCKLSECTSNTKWIGDYGALKISATF